MKRLKAILKENRGFTMVEVLVVLSVLAVVFGISSLSLGIQPATEAKKVSYSIDSMISRTKAGTLARAGDVYMEIQCDASGKIILNYYEDDTLKESEVLTKYGTGVAYTLVGSSTKEFLNKNESLILAFDRRTTGFLTLYEAAALSDTGSGLIDVSEKCSDIWIVGGYVDYSETVDSQGGVQYQIKLGPTTGTHTNISLQ